MMIVRMKKKRKILNIQRKAKRMNNRCHIVFNRQIHFFKQPSQSTLEKLVSYSIYQIPPKEEWFLLQFPGGWNLCFQDRIIEFIRFSSTVAYHGSIV